MEKFLTLKEMAEVLNVCQDTLRREAIAGRIPFVKIGRVFRFRIDHVLNSLGKSPCTDSRRGAFELRDDTYLGAEAPADAQQSGPRLASPEGQSTPADSPGNDGTKLSSKPSAN
jgi:excisionase family DNA binding protein